MQKYQLVLDLGSKLNIQNEDVWEENVVLKIKGIAKTPYEKNILWDEIIDIGGQNPVMSKLIYELLIRMFTSATL